MPSDIDPRGGSRTVPPPCDGLDIAKFATAFRSTNTSYKFLWASALFSILAEEGVRSAKISLRRLAAGMLDAARRPICVFRLRSGKDDQTGLWFRQLEDSPQWGRKLLTRLRGKVFAARPQDIPGTIVEGLTKYVPSLFLSPFFEAETRGMTGPPKFQRIRDLAQAGFEQSAPPPYRFSPTGDVIVHPKWVEYIVRNEHILKSWTLWHWARYMQRMNPVTPAVVTKLDENAKPNTRRQRNFWRRVIEARGVQFPCMYTRQSVAPDNFALDHYVPWSFVVHDNLWNLAPVSVFGNAEKSDKLPDNAAYFDAFTDLQFLAITSFHTFPDRKKWEDLFDSYSTELNLDVIDRVPDKAALREALSGAIGPLLSIARSRDFPSDWRFLSS